MCKKEHRVNSLNLRGVPCLWWTCKNIWREKRKKSIPLFIIGDDRQTNFCSYALINDTKRMGKSCMQCQVLRCCSTHLGAVAPCTCLSNFLLRGPKWGGGEGFVCLNGRNIFAEEKYSCRRHISCKISDLLFSGIRVQWQISAGADSIKLC